MSAEEEITFKLLSCDLLQLLFNQKDFSINCGGLLSQQFGHGWSLLLKARTTLSTHRIVYNGEENQWWTIIFKRSVNKRKNGKLAKNQLTPTVIFTRNPTTIQHKNKELFYRLCHKHFSNETRTELKHLKKPSAYSLAKIKVLYYYIHEKQC